MEIKFGMHGENVEIRYGGIYYRSYENGVYGEIHCAEEGEALFYPCLYAKDGIVYLLWNRQSSNAGEIVLSTIDEEGIHDVQVVSTSKETYRPSICITEDHTIYVAYDSLTEQLRCDCKSM